MSGLQLEGVVKRRGGTPVLRDLALSVPGGSVMALLGASGCGKTTLLRLLAGFDRCDAGTITLDDIVVDGPAVDVPPERRGIGYVPQEGLLFPHLSVAGNVGFGLGRVERRAGRIAETLRLCGLDQREELAKRYPHQLSGGQQQRVALARALARRPRLVLLDEPFNGLDAALRRSVAAEVATVLRRAGATAVLVTHDPQEAFAVADRVAVIQDGTVVQEAEPALLYWRPASLAVARLSGPTLALPGVVRDGVAETPLGCVPVVGPQLNAPDGRATVLLRPEQVRATAAGQGRCAQVQGHVFAGDHTDVAATIGGLSIQLRLRTPVGEADQVWLAVDGGGTAFPL